ncbi:hypothetical protein COBT_003221, partial [Conglomerata obtusa]
MFFDFAFDAKCGANTSDTKSIIRDAGSESNLLPKTNDNIQAAQVAPLSKNDCLQPLNVIYDKTLNRKEWERMYENLIPPTKNASASVRAAYKGDPFDEKWKMRRLDESQPFLFENVILSKKNDVKKKEEKSCTNTTENTLSSFKNNSLP